MQFVGFCCREMIDSLMELIRREEVDEAEWEENEEVATIPPEFEEEFKLLYRKLGYDQAPTNATLPTHPQPSIMLEMQEEEFSRIRKETANLDKIEGDSIIEKERREKEEGKGRVS